MMARKFESDKIIIVINAIANLAGMLALFMAFILLAILTLILKHYHERFFRDDYLEYWNEPIIKERENGR